MTGSTSNSTQKARSPAEPQDMDFETNSSFKASTRIGLTRVTLADGKVSVKGGIPGVRTRLTKGLFHVQIGDEATRYWRLELLEAGAPGREMTPSSSDELLEVVEATGARSYPALTSLMTFFVLLTLTIAVSVPAWLKLLMLGASMYASIALWQILSARARAIVFYELSGSKAITFAELGRALNAYGKESGELRIVNTWGNLSADESKRNAGSDSAVHLQRAHVRYSDHPGMFCNLKLPSVSGDKDSITFLPDGIIASGESGASLVSYKSLSCRSSKKEWVGPGFSRKAKEIGNTWQYVNKSGERDKRFRNNKRIPIYEIELSMFSSKKMPDFYVISPVRGLGKLLSPLIASLGGKKTREITRTTSKRASKKELARRQDEEFQLSLQKLQDLVEKLDNPEPKTNTKSRAIGRIQPKDAPSSLPDTPGVYYWIDKKSDDPIYIGLAIGPGGLRAAIVDEQLNPDFLEFDPKKQSSENAFQLAHPVERADGAKGIDKDEFRRCIGQAYRVAPGNGTVQYIHKNCLLVYHVFDEPDQAKEHWEAAIEEWQPPLNFCF